MNKFTKHTNPNEHTIYRSPTATILKSEEINDTFAPYIASISSRGPSTVTFNILKVI